MVEFEWKPFQCTKYKNFGHELKECEKQISEEAASRKAVMKEGQKFGIEEASKQTNKDVNEMDSIEVSKKISNKDTVKQREGKQHIEQPSKYNLNLRRGNIRRGLVIREVPVNTGNSFADLEEKKRNEDGVAKPPHPGGGVGEGGSGLGRVGETSTLIDKICFWNT